MEEPCQQTLQQTRDEPRRTHLENDLVLLPPPSLEAGRDLRRLHEADPALLTLVVVALLVDDVDDVLKEERAPEVEVVEERHHGDDPDELLDGHPVPCEPAEDRHPQHEEMAAFRE